jgi:acyl-coenzyme A synthetase/AMP-(fatty) acid ligase
MQIDFLLSIFEENRESDAVVWKDRIYTYDWLLSRIDHWRNEIAQFKINRGAVIVLEAEFSPNALALFLALIEHSCIIVPLTSSVENKKPDFIEIAQAEIDFVFAPDDQASYTELPQVAEHDLYLELRRLDHPGLVLFSSGSTGESKAAVHDLSRLLRKFTIRRHDLRTLTFLLFDHIGGIDTLLYSLSNGSCIITVNDRSPDNICRVIEAHKVEVLPVSPTFLNLLLLSQAHERYDLSSLKYITYGTEVMPEVTLRRCAEVFPHVTILQKYGTTEVGTLRSKSKSSDSLWVKIGGEGFRIRVVDGILQIKASSAMIGYLNAPSPFTDDGWFVTGDMVEQNGEYLRFLGRGSEIINVGGEKVYPAEVEAVIQEMDNIADVTVIGEKNPLVGNIVCAKISLIDAEDRQALSARIKRFCSDRMQQYKVPVKVEIISDVHHGDRFKKMRKNLHTSDQS